MEEGNSMFDDIWTASKPNYIRVSQSFMDAYWESFAKIGPRHRLVERWINKLGWHIEPHVYENFVARD
jgi:hypothetical protein